MGCEEGLDVEERRQGRVHRVLRGCAIRQGSGEAPVSDVEEVKEPVIGVPGGASSR